MNSTKTYMVEEERKYWCVLKYFENINDAHKFFWKCADENPTTRYRVREFQTIIHLESTI